MSNLVERVDLKTMSDDRGSLSVGEGAALVPFSVRRFFILHDLLKGQSRGGHANRDAQLLMVVSGAARIVTHDGTVESEHNLSDPSSALLIRPIVWRTIQPLSEGAVVLVLSSSIYSEENYIRDFSRFKQTVGARDA